MSLKFTILGCGYSLGVPRIDGYFGSCDPMNKKNYRTRCSAIITSKKRSILIDTSPDIKTQLYKNKIKNIDNVFYTHEHADQTHGINDLYSTRKIKTFAALVFIYSLDFTDNIFLYECSFEEKNTYVQQRLSCVKTALMFKSKTWWY